MNMSETELRELDAWIAECVMGYKRWHFDNGHPASRSNYLSADKERQDTYRRHGFVDGWPILDNYPHYTTNPADAFAVLKKCAEKEVIEVCCDNGLHSLSVANEEKPSLYTQADTLELAICLFAKKLFSE